MSDLGQIVRFPHREYITGENHFLEGTRYLLNVITVNCNFVDRRIWINLELAKKPEDGLEYIIVLELMLLLEKHHNDNFKALMDRYLPDWRVRKDVLNRFPLSYEEWEY